MSDAKVYLVTAGCYSDYHIHAAFTTRAAAEAYKAEYDARQSWLGERPDESYDKASIEEWDLDVPHAWPTGAYGAHVNERGKLTWSGWDEGYDPNRPAHSKRESWGDRHLVFYGYGPTREHARRSAEELRRVTLTEPPVFAQN